MVHSQPDCLTPNRSTVNIIRSYVKAASDIIEGTSDNHERLLRSYRFSKQNIEVLVQRLVTTHTHLYAQETNELQLNLESMQSAIHQQLDRFKIENESLKRKLQDLSTSDENKKASLNSTATNNVQAL